jgi:hypothetical protein
MWSVRRPVAGLREVAVLTVAGRRPVIPGTRVVAGGTFDGGD